MKTKKILTLAAALAAFFLLASCSPSISVHAKNSDDVQVDFSAGFSKQAESAILELFQAAAGITQGNQQINFDVASIFSETEIENFLIGAGATNVSAKSTQDKISASLAINSLSTNPLAATGILTRTANSLSFTIGPEQLNALYEKLNEENQGYLDLLMIPALNDDEMTVAEYRGLLASLYGAELADEVCGGTLSIELKSPDSKKVISQKIPLGELLTLAESKTWSVSW